MKIKQILITRFNIVSSYSYKLPFDAEADEEYLERRFRLFEEYTFPSVIASENKDFTWIVLFSEKTPEKFKKRIKMLERKSMLFRPLFLDGREEGRRLTKEYCLEISALHHEICNRVILSYDADCFLISRIDNDDAISKKYMSFLYNYVINRRIEKECALYFDKGFQYDTFYRLLGQLQDKNNHFYSILSMRKNILIPIFIDHGSARKEIYTINIDTDPMWIEITHGGNLGNKCVITPKTVVNNRMYLRDFELKDPPRIHSPLLSFFLSCILSIKLYTTRVFHS